jgi:hypothetical protein
MVWSSTAISDFLLNVKELTIKLGRVICVKSDLGQPIDGYLDVFYLVCNLGFSLEEAGSSFTDDELDYLYGLYTNSLVQHNRYKGL